MIVNSIFQMLNYPNVDLFATRFSHKLPLYVSPVPDSNALAVDPFSMNWNSLHASAFPPIILISSILAKICQSQCRIVLIAPFWPQWPWFSELLQLLVSTPIHLPLFPRLLTQSKVSTSKISTPKLPITQPSCLGVIKQSIRDKKFSKDVANFVLKSRQKSTQKGIIYSNWCHRRKIDLVSAPLTVIADFLIYLFSEKKYQISTIKGYRAMISNTLIKLVTESDLIQSCQN